MNVDSILQSEVERQPYPLVFATISGAHLYGFPSPDSDYDLRGVHVLPVREVIGLEVGPDTLQVAEDRDGIELDLVTHDIGKFCGMLLRRNGYVLEQLFSPLVVSRGEDHEELKSIAPGCVTRNHAHHYLGFANTQWALYERQMQIKPLLYVFRVLKTGIRLMRTGVVESNLNTLLDDEPRIDYLPDLIAQKRSHGEHSLVNGEERYLSDVNLLRTVLEQCREESQLPELPSVQRELNDFVIRVRLQASTE